MISYMASVGRKNKFKLAKSRLYYLLPFKSFKGFLTSSGADLGDDQSDHGTKVKIGQNIGKLK